VSRRKKTSVPHDRFGRFARRFRGCRVPGCAAQHYSKGFCRGHLSAFSRGRIDTEGIPVRGYDVRVTGPELRKFRRDQNWNQERLADLLGISKSYLQALESSRGPLPDRIADLLNTLRRALAASAIKSDKDKPRLRFQEGFRSSATFSELPPFAALPTCPCEDGRCRLSPVKDGDWDGQHLWKFQGKRCHGIRYVNARGKIVPRPRELSRDPLLQKRCSQCGRLRQIDRRYRARLRGYALTLRCVPQAGDVPDQKHDPPERFIERDGQVCRLTATESDVLRNRSTLEFPFPTCERAGCPKFGKRMEHSTDLSKTVTSDAVQRIAMYACRPSGPAKSHYAYRTLPRGEVVEQIAEGRYRWKDATTGEVHETVRKRRPVRKDRLMPAAVKCPRHGCALIPRRGPWRRGKVKVWLAVCRKGHERWHVRDDRSVSAPTKGGRRKSGPRPGSRSESTVARITIAADILLTNPTATLYSMAGILFPEQNLKERAYDNAKQFFQRNKREIKSARKRLKALSANDRATAVEEAKQRLRSR
jgi:transcriptional regulator with XRE-family HTH domain